MSKIIYLPLLACSRCDGTGRIELRPGVKVECPCGSHPEEAA